MSQQRKSLQSKTMECAAAASSMTYPTLPKTLLIISLKMYFTPTRTLDYLRALLDPANDIVRPQNRSKLLLALIPDFLTIYPCSEIITKFENAPEQQQHQPSGSSTSADGGGGDDLPPPFFLGAQDCFWDSLGAYTGEVSPLNLRSMGVSIVELGHAERRSIFRETDGEVALKAAAVSNHGMIPLACIGEANAPGDVAAEAIRSAVEECKVQVKAVLEAVPAQAPVIFAYEPVWAIGKPVPAGVDHVAAVVKGIRHAVEEISGGKRAGEVRVLYGGSAGPGLWGDGGLGKAVDGMFLGRFAHDPEGVRKVVREVEQTLA